MYDLCKFPLRFGQSSTLHHVISVLAQQLIYCSLLLLQNITFATPFFTEPVALITARNDGSNRANTFCQRQCPLSSWVEVQFIATNYLHCKNDTTIYKESRLKDGMMFCAMTMPIIKTEKKSRTLITENHFDVHRF